MIVRNIRLENFRNYGKFYADFDDTINIIIGDNAQGKTNLLESIYYLTSGRSFRSRYDKEIIRLDADTAFVEADIFADGRGQKITAKLFRGRGKQLFANGVKLRTVSELSGKLTAVIFSPDDLYLIKDGASARRRLLDMCISQLRPKYAAAVTEYTRVYDRKLRILRDYHEKPSLLEMLDEYNFRLAKLSALLISYRAGFTEKLDMAASEIHREFSGGTETLSVTYQTLKNIENPKLSPSELFPLVMAHQKTHRQAEIQSGLCLSGAHKDDLEISINGTPARNFASQGQLRTAALSLKLAERKLLSDDRGEAPVLLLDDVLSELDPVRQNYVLNRINSGQVFITCCEESQILKLTGGKVLKIRKGEIV